MRLLLAILAVQFFAFGAFADGMSFLPKNIEIRNAELDFSANTSLDFDRIDEDIYGAIIVVRYREFYRRRLSVKWFDVEIPGHTIIREENKLFLVSDKMTSLLAEKKGFIFKYWKLADTFEFSSEISFEGFTLIIKPTLTNLMP